MIFVTGFLGAGKSTLAKHLRATEGIETVEIPGLKTAGALPSDAAPRAVISAIDVANLPALLDDPLTAALIHAQIAEADLLAMTRTDLVEAGPVIGLLRPLAQCPIVEAPNGALAPDDGLRRQAGALARHDLSDQFIEWQYEGAAAMTVAEAEALLADRPPGTYRLHGTVNTGEAALELQLAGRVRQTQPRPAVRETCLSAWGRKGQFSARAMDTVFSEKVASSVSMGSIFSYR